MSTKTALDQIKARVEGHTEGAWVAQNLEREHGHRGIYWVTSEHEGSQVVAEIDANDGRVEAIWKFADAELIAAAPKLLAALEAVEALHYADEEAEEVWPEQCSEGDCAHPDYECHAVTITPCNECSRRGVYYIAYPCPTITAITEALR